MSSIDACTFVEGMIEWMNEWMSIIQVGTWAYGGASRLHLFQVKAEPGACGRQNHISDKCGGKMKQAQIYKNWRPSLSFWDTSGRHAGMHWALCEQWEVFADPAVSWEKKAYLHPLSIHYLISTMPIIYVHDLVKPSQPHGGIYWYLHFIQVSTEAQRH